MFDLGTSNLEIMVLGIFDLGTYDLGIDKE